MDQAEKLRKIAIQKINHVNEVLPEKPSKKVKANKARLISIVAAKGAVGKSAIVVNLAQALIEAGQRAVIIDAFFGTAKIQSPVNEDFVNFIPDSLKSRIESKEILSISAKALNIMSAKTDAEETVKLSKQDIISISGNINVLDDLYDSILIDLDAGLNENMLNIALASDEIVLVCSKEAKIMTDSYALIKKLALRDPKKTVKVFINETTGEAEAKQVFSKLKEVSVRFASAKVESLGYMKSNDTCVLDYKFVTPRKVNNL